MAVGSTSPLGHTAAHACKRIGLSFVNGTPDLTGFTRRTGELVRGITTWYEKSDPASVACRTHEQEQQAQDQREQEQLRHEAEQQLARHREQDAHDRHVLSEVERNHAIAEAQREQSVAQVLAVRVLTETLARHGSADLVATKQDAVAHARAARITLMARQAAELRAQEQQQQQQQTHCDAMVEDETVEQALARAFDAHQSRLEALEVVLTEQVEAETQRRLADAQTREIERQERAQSRLHAWY